MNREEWERTKAGWRRPKPKSIAGTPGLAWPCKVEVGMAFIYKWDEDSPHVGLVETVVEILSRHPGKFWASFDSTFGKMGLNEDGFCSSPKLWVRVK